MAPLFVDNGICDMDKFNKMIKSALSVLLQVMDQQTLSIARVGVIFQLNAHNLILANQSINYIWKPKGTVMDKIQLLIFRFELVFLITDMHDKLYNK